MGTRFVITAAHCFTGNRIIDIRVVIGDTTLGVANDTTRFILKVTEIRQHPNFDRQTGSNDIAVVVLSSPVDLKAYPNIKPACLPITETKSDMYGRSAVVSGWGKDASEGIRSSNLNKVPGQILSDCGQSSLNGS